MTLKEHALMIGIIASQIESMKALADILTSRGIVDAGDLQAFWSIRTPEARQQSLALAHQMYWTLAREVGIDTEGLEPSPKQ